MRRQLLAYLSLRDWKTRLVFWSGALAVGGIAGVFAIASNWVIEKHEVLIAHSRWWTLLVAPGGLMLVAFLTRYVFPGTQGSGIPQAIAALRMEDEPLRRKVLSLRIAVGKILMTLLGLLCGASIGREGPTVHIGASIMFSLARFTRFPARFIEHGLILAGGAAGIGAAFNTPIAGIIFAIEEMARFYEERATGTLLVAVVLAGITSMAMLGNYTYFGATGAGLSHTESWLAIPLCGIVGGLLGGLFSRLLVVGTRRLAPVFVKHPLWVAGACGLVIAAIGLVSAGASYGTGYDQARAVLESGQNIYGDDQVHFLLRNPSHIFFPVWKILATLASYLSGIPGGIFSPSLSAGAGLGADLSVLVPTAPVAAVIILGMVGYFTGVVQTPITASVIVMEMVNDHSMIIPIMATAFIALGASKLVCREAIYWALADAFLGTPVSKAVVQEPDEQSEKDVPSA